MSGQVKVAFVGDISDLKRKLNNLDKELNGAGTGLEKFSAKTSQIGQSLTKIGAGFTAAVTVPLVLFGKKSVQAFNDAEEAATKLSTNLLNVKGNTEENVKSIQRLTKSLQKKGVIDDDVLNAGASQLATFKLQGKTIETLTPKIADMIAQLKGFNATSEDAVKINNLVGKVMTGNVGALSRYGVTLDDNQKQLLKTGNETQRAAVLVEVLSQNYGNVNEKLAKTPQGKWKQFMLTMQDLMESLGEVIAKTLLPALQKLANFIKPLAAKFETLPTPAKTVIVVVGLLAAAIGPLILALGALATALSAIAANPVVLAIAAIVVAIAAFVAAIVLLYNKNEEFRQLVQTAWENIQKAVSAAWQFLQPIFDALKQAWENLKNKLEQFAQKHPEVIEGLKQMALFFGVIAGSGIVAFFGSLVTVLAGVVGVLDAVAWGIDKMSNAITGLENIINKLPDPVKKILGIQTGVDAKFSNKDVQSKLGFTGPNLKKITIVPSSAQALGGPVRAGMPYKVGEGGGPEMFIPSSDGTIVNARQTRGLGNTYNVTVNTSNSTLTEDGLMRVLRRHESLYVA